jgi:hypothetical protein
MVKRTLLLLNPYITIDVVFVNSEINEVFIFIVIYKRSQNCEWTGFPV